MFEVRVNGKTVANVDEQVIGVSLMSARGELYKAGISNEGVIDVVLHTVNAGDPVRLDQLEAAQQRFNSALVEGQVTGNAPWQPSPGLTGKQQMSDVTTRPGGENGSDQVLTQPPAVDLAQGLTVHDGDILTVRIEQFAEHGDAHRAVRENPADGSKPQTAEQGAVQQEPETSSATGEAGTPSEGVTNTNPTFDLSGSSGGSTPPPESVPQGNLGSGKGPLPGDASQLGGASDSGPVSPSTPGSSPGSGTPPEPQPNA